MGKRPDRLETWLFVGGVVVVVLIIGLIYWLSTLPENYF